MQLGRCVIIAIFSLGLQSCATHRYSVEHHDLQQMETGRVYFQTGNYSDAFRYLLPLAVEGKPEAEYAVGYMYYYGYGVPMDTESGIFWIDKSAEQDYPQAITAVDLIHQHDLDEAKAAEDRKKVSDIRLMQAPIAVTPRHLKKISMNEQPSETVSAPDEKPIDEIKQPTPQPIQKAVLKAEPISPKFTLQLYGSYELVHVKYLQSQLRLKNTGHIYQTSHQGKDWYVLTFGNFGTAHEATATKQNLPKNLRELSPWVRKVDTLNRLA